MTFVRTRHQSALARRRAAACLLLTLPAWTAAQAVDPSLPNAGQLLQQAQPTIAPLKPGTGTPLTVLLPDGQPMPESMAFEVRAITLTGNTILSTETLNALLADALGQSLTLAQLDTLAARVTNAYRNAGQPLARAIVPPQTIKHGSVTLQVIEARFGEVRLNNGSRNHDWVINNTLSAMKSQELVSQDRLDYALLRLSDMPGVNATATLAPGAVVGSSDILVDVQAAPPVSGQVTLDNQGSNSTGRGRASGAVNVLNPLGLGDVLSVNGMSSGRGMQYARASYEAQAHGSGTRVGLTASTLRYELIDSLATLQAHGTAEVVGLSLRQPLLRSGATNLSTTLNVDHTTLNDRVDSSALATDRRLTTSTLALQGDHADDVGPGGTGGVTLATLALTSGRVGFDNAAAAQADETGARTAGNFSKWRLNVSRQQGLGRNTSLYASLNVQGASGNLDASQKLSAGGPNGVRAYDTGVGSGDEGQMLSLELRHTVPLPLTGQWQVLAFADAAHMTTNRVPSQTAGTNRVDLSGAGLGLAWSHPKGWQARLSIAAPLGKAPTVLNTDGSTRVWLDISARF